MSFALERENKKRLIVLLPNSLEINTRLAHQVYWIALQEGFNVLYLAIQNDQQDALAIERSMATMEATTAGKAIRVDWRRVKSGELRQAIVSAYRPGDVFACHEAHSLTTGLFRQTRVMDYVQNELNAPARALRGVSLPIPRTAVQSVQGVLAWLGFFAILAGFTTLQVILRGFSMGAAGKLLMVLTAAVEIGSLYAWDQING